MLLSFFSLPIYASFLVTVQMSVYILCIQPTCVSTYLYVCVSVSVYISAHIIIFFNYFCISTLFKELHIHLMVWSSVLKLCSDVASHFGDYSWSSAVVLVVGKLLTYVCKVAFMQFTRRSSHYHLSGSVLGSACVCLCVNN